MTSLTHRPAVYMLASARKGTLYVGVTNDTARRVWEHKNDVAEGFTRRYGVHMLVWLEFHETMPLAVAREKCIKKWHREWKINAIEAANPNWQDLYQEMLR